MKPNKKIYDNQKDVWKEASKYLDSILSKCNSIKEAYVWASLAEEKFGIYDEPYRGQTCSDIDLVLVMNEPVNIPKEWNFTNVEKSWFDLYHLGYFEYQGNKHQIDGLIVIPSKHNLNKMQEALKGRSKKLI
ncbi:hypothetical protein J4465_00465 [Candidatus Pacearchaeota archaeon]|nr:hypothetical protein [Candidatus Pacearchaeota archaeon]